MSVVEDFPDLIHGRYRYLEEIGRGGMGRVVLVEDLRHGCKRALKWVEESGEESTAEAVRQLREYQILSRFQHPNLLRVYEYGRALPRGGYFFTSEVLTGPSVRGLVGCSSPEVGRRLLFELFRALNFLHRQGWVHGDIKPDNLRLRAPIGEPNDDLCLLDLGLAHPIGRPPEEKILGTVHYMPPERLLGGRIDSRGDLYSAGVLAFQILTGRLPFAGNRKTEVFEGHLRRPPPDPRQLAPDTPTEIAGLLFSLLEKRPEDRPGSAEEVMKIFQRNWGGFESGPETTSTLVAHVRLREEAIWDGPVAQIDRRVRERCGEGGAVFRRWSKTAAAETSSARPMRAASIAASAGSMGMMIVRGQHSGDLRLFRAEILRRLQVQGHTVLRWNAGGDGAHARLLEQIETVTAPEMRLPEIAELSPEGTPHDEQPAQPTLLDIGSESDARGFLPLSDSESRDHLQILDSDSRDLLRGSDSDSSHLGDLTFSDAAHSAPQSQPRRGKRRKADSPMVKTLEKLAHLARFSPVIVLVEGAHAGTSETFAVLNEAIAQERRLVGLDHVVWVALVDSRPGAWFSEWSARSDVNLWSRVLELPSLDAEGVEAIIRSRFPGWDPTPATCTQLLETSGGSPSHLERNLIDFVRQGGLTRFWGHWEAGQLPSQETSRIVERARRAFSRLSHDEQRMLEALAVTDHPSDPVELQRLAESPPGKTPELLISLLQKKWLARETASGFYRFARSFQSIAVASMIDPQRRKSVHQLAGDLLQAQVVGRGTPEDWARLSRHRVESGQLTEAWSPLIQFIEHGASEGDPSLGIRRAESFIEQDAWRPVPGLTGEHRGVLHDALGMLRLRQGDVTGAEREWRLAERYFVGTPVAPHRTGRLQTRLGSLLLRRGDATEAMPRLRASLKALTGHDRGDLLRQHLILLAEANLMNGQAEASTELWSALDKLGPPESPTLDAEAVLLRADHSIRRGHVLLAREQLTSGLGRIEHAGRPVAGWVAMILGRLYSIARNDAAARQQYRLAASLFQRQQQPLFEARSLIDLAETLRRALLMGDAERSLLRAERQLDRSGGNSDRPHLLWLRSSLLADGGWVREARTSLIELAEWGDRLPHSPWRWEASLLEAELMLRMGNLRRAIQLLSGAAHPAAAPHGHLGDVWCRWSVLGMRLALRKGSPAEALMVAEEAIAEARERCDAAGLAPIWRERIRTLRVLGCEESADRLVTQLQLPEEDVVPNAEAGGEEFAEHLAALAREAEDAGQHSQASIHYEEALFHALRVRALPLGAILPLRLAMVRARDDQGSEMAARQAWKRLMKSDLRLGRVEVLCLWARSRERAEDSDGAASLRRAAVREIARWSAQIPMKHDLFTLARGLRADLSVLDAISGAIHTG